MVYAKSIAILARSYSSLYIEVFCSTGEIKRSRRQKVSTERLARSFRGDWPVTRIRLNLEEIVDGSFDSC